MEKMWWGVRWGIDMGLEMEMAKEACWRGSLLCAVEENGGCWEYGMRMDYFAGY